MPKNCVLCGRGWEFRNVSSFPQLGKALKSKSNFKWGEKEWVGETNTMWGETVAAQAADLWVSAYHQQYSRGRSVITDASVKMRTRHFWQN